MHSRGTIERRTEPDYIASVGVARQIGAGACFLEVSDPFVELLILDPNILEILAASVYLVRNVIAIAIVTVVVIVAVIVTAQ